MQCENTQCHSDAQVKLSTNLERETWLCPYCASKTLRAVNPNSFFTIKEKSMIDYSKDHSKK